jgi:hypothetical protein
LWQASFLLVTNPEKVFSPSKVEAEIVSLVLAGEAASASVPPAAMARTATRAVGSLRVMWLSVSAVAACR